jgi:outer membrane receptor protein involved in Fe transport
MAKSRSLQQAVRFALATAATAAAGVTALHAQEAPAPAAAAAAPVEEVVVTGSRLQTPNETSISPITTVSAVDLQKTGLTRVEDVLNNLPMVFAGMNATTANGADGTATVDLRGLGNQRTLVLVDGLRLGPGSPLGGRNFSDINQIPAALIERVDVLTGGASAVYGADAVAGVVNFIMKTHFEGVQIDAGYNFYQHHNGDQAGVAGLVTASGFPLPASDVNTGFGKYASFIMGSNFADNRGNATAYVTYNNQGSSLQSSFDYSACSLGVTTLASGAKGLTCAGSSTSAKNGAGGDIRVPNAAGKLLQYTVDGANNNNFRRFTGADLYNFGPLNYYLNPSERWTAGGFMNYDVNSHVTVYSSVMFMRNSTNAQIAPSGAFSVTAAFVACANPLLNASELAVICPGGVPSPGGASSESYTDPKTGVTTIYPGENIGIGRRNVEGGNRTFEARNNSNREVLGIKGDFGDAAQAWTYNVSAQHSNTDVGNSNANYTSNTAVQQALNVLPVGTNGAPVCGGPTSPNPPLVAPGTGFAVNANCVPWNIWKAGGVTPQALAFISLPLTEQGSTQEYVVTGSATADFGKYGWKMPWADQGLQGNFGAEWRQENTEFLPDFEEQQGNGGGVGGPTVPISGGFSVRELFTELRLPLASHQAFFEDLSLEGGYRYSKYSEGFSTNTYKLGLEWAPVRDVRFRGSYQRAVRAPNIGELFAPQAVGLDGSFDPCAGSVPRASQAACTAMGVKPGQYGNIDPNPSPQYNGLLGGNPNLKPETADTYTVGVVLQPRFIQNLTVSVDYYNIRIKDVIGIIGSNNIMNDCEATLSASFCGLVHRDQFGSIWLTNQGFVTDTTVNLGELRTTGIDVKGSYRLPMNTLGSLLFSLEGTYTQKNETTPVPGFGSYDCVGFYGFSCGGGIPKWRHVFNTTWSTPWAGFDLNVRWRYIGALKSEQTSTNPFLAGTSFVTNHFPAYNYVDLTGSFNVFKNVRLELGVNNIADKAPPIIGGADCSTSSPAGANCNGNTFPGVYDALGRYLFATVTATF